jgi:hypothetical protein
MTPQVILLLLGEEARMRGNLFLSRKLYPPAVFFRAKARCKVALFISG